MSPCCLEWATLTSFTLPLYKWFRREVHHFHMLKTTHQKAFASNLMVYEQNRKQNRAMWIAVYSFKLMASNMQPAHFVSIREVFLFLCLHFYICFIGTACSACSCLVLCAMREMLLCFCLCLERLGMCNSFAPPAFALLFRVKLSVLPGFYCWLSIYMHIPRHRQRVQLCRPCDAPATSLASAVRWTKWKNIQRQLLIAKLSG